MLDKILLYWETQDILEDNYPDINLWVQHKTLKSVRVYYCVSYQDDNTIIWEWESIQKC